MDHVTGSRSAASFVAAGNRKCNVVDTVEGGGGRLRAEAISFTTEPNISFLRWRCKMHLFTDSC